MSKELMVRPENNYMISEQTIKVAEFLSKSKLVPQHFRGDIGSCIIALNVASRSGADPFMVMQSLYLVHGKPAFETKYLVAAFNSCGRFTPIEYKFNSAKTECTAYSTVIRTGKKIEGTTVSIDMAKKNGWYDKSGSPWQKLPELMLTYRAAAFLIRIHAPEITMGMNTVDEVQDIKGVPEAEYTVHENVQQEINQNANQQPLDMKKEDEYVPSEAMIEKLNELIGVEKEAGRNKDETLKYISGYVNRKIERLRELSEDEIDDYIKMVKDELSVDQPSWAE